MGNNAVVSVRADNLEFAAELCLHSMDQTLERLLERRWIRHVYYICPFTAKMHETCTDRVKGHVQVTSDVCGLHILFLRRW